MNTKYQVRDNKGNIVDKNLSYEEARMWSECPFGNRFKIEKMKESDQNDCDPL